jgi:uncharacterized repeat protein (TIGR03847 family)
MSWTFDSPDKVMVGTLGEVGNRVFLLQVRQGGLRVVAKCEKQQLAALATWLVAVLEDMERPGHLPEELALEEEYEPDLVVGEVTVGLDETTGAITLLLVSSEDEETTLEIALDKEWAAALAIAITRLVEQGRPPCPLCGLPLDARGHDCPRTNGHLPPLR